MNRKHPWVAVSMLASLLLAGSVPTSAAKSSSIRDASIRERSFRNAITEVAWMKGTDTLESGTNASSLHINPRLNPENPRPSA